MAVGSGRNVAGIAAVLRVECYQRAPWWHHRRNVAAVYSTRCACARNEPPAFSTTMLLDLSFWPVFRLLLIQSCRRENLHRADRFPGSRPTVNFLSSPLSVPLSFTRPAGSATRAIATWPSVTCVYSIPSLPS